MSRVQEILNQKKERKIRLEGILNTMINNLIELGALKIILYGSLNSGEIEINSDLDLFVIMPSIKSGKDWMSFIYDKLDREVACDIIVYNQTEFGEELPNNSFLSEILDTGKIVYEEKL